MDYHKELQQLRAALDEIRKSSSVDFETPLLWGQWCRDVAENAAGPFSGSHAGVLMGPPGGDPELRE